MSTRDDDEQGTPPYPTPLSSAHITDAIIRSPDNGITLFLFKLNISDIGAHEAQELAGARNNDRQETGSVVERLALARNLLTTLPNEFALLTRLRYLNLKHNCFSTFPDVLTLMPSLDTLDISHNKIKKLPLQPGHLVKLRVFSFSRNKITRLPAYLAGFRTLDVLKIERNPLDWPPSSVIDSFGKVDDCKEWIQKFQNWLESETTTGQEYDDSGYSEQPNWDNELQNVHDGWRFPVRGSDFDAGLTPHARSFSIDSNTSMSSIIESSLETDPPNFCTSISSKRPSSPQIYRNRAMAPLAQGMLSNTCPDDMLSPTSAENNYEDQSEEQLHSRTASFASTLRKPQSAIIAGKKSLPDLRTVHKEPPKRMPYLLEGRSPIAIYSDASGLDDPSSRPPSPVKEEGSSSGSGPPGTMAYNDDLLAPNSHALSFITTERYAYFRRSSTIPINSAFPKSLQCLHESARSILFAMSQLYRTLELYVIHGMDERISLIFKKVLDPANVNMLHLIRSLDRFDDVSQKSTPSSAVCRGLIECCRDTVTVFRKAVSLLTLQIGAEPTEDARYVRWLVMELYAVSAEVAFAWQALVPQIGLLKPFLYGSVFSQTSNFSYSASGSGTLPALTVSPNPDQRLAPSLRLRPIEPIHSSLAIVGTGRARTARRHAGSFSSKDVQIGKELPSYDVLPVPSMVGRLPTHLPTSRTPKRQATVPIVTTSTPNPLSSSSIHFTPFRESFHHLRQESQMSIGEVSSPMVSIEPSATNNKLPDHSPYQAVRYAVELAPLVWDQIEEALGEILDTDQEAQEALDKARAVTKGLSADILKMSEGNSESDRKVFRENAHLFLKTFVQVSNLLKTRGNGHSVSAALRSNMLNLTNFTEQFTIPPHISSIPPSTPRQYSPTFNLTFAPSTSNFHAAQDNQLGSSLSRAQTAQPATGAIKHSLSLPTDSTRAVVALPAKTSTARRLRPLREPPIEDTDPG
ncbi:RAM signaling pathway protein-domain-containing protein [Crassisporium funariophilum]|nr:RAM signaling pathway protein-domain-containing protein [Crassisporium funariophilum]